MGQAKYNKTAILAKQGKLPPKSRKPGKRESERLLAAAIMARMMGVVPIKPKKEKTNEDVNNG